MTNERYLIVNADDFGLSPGVNEGILAAHDRGVVTSASLMVRWPAAEAAADSARSRFTLSLGLHLDLGEWFFRDGDWHQLYAVVPTDDPDALAAEVDRQLSRFRELVGRDPTHLDSHQHVHREKPLARIVADLACRLDVPLRHRDPAIRYDGHFYGQSGHGEPFPDAITVDALINLLTCLPPGIAELGCHPGLNDDVDSMYRTERTHELQTLCDPRVRAAIEAEDIRLCSFAEARTYLNTSMVGQTA
jgi:predicted glycoside hydrolase/deacetylase ChbG (UPF0249 family)